mmetsp:Transcript_70252/g.206035  ORF Transcript_70252/g.206035 Transcript_70252/m.206035 type:complete len:206 (+) Transcript_70252:284-901(+)
MSVLLQLVEVQHLVGVVEPVGLLRPLRAVDHVDDHARDVVAAVQLQAHPDQLRADLGEVHAGIALQPIPDKTCHPLPLHDVPEAVAGQDAEAPGPQPGHLVDVRNAGHLLVPGLPVRVALVLEVPEAPAHRQVPVEARGLLVRDEAAGCLDAGLLRREVRLVVDGLGDQRPGLGRGGAAPAACEMRGHPHGERLLARLLLGRVPH